MKPGRELDALIAAKVMGWEVGKDYVVVFMVEELYLVKSLDDLIKWSPSTDIAAAWEVVEKLKSLGFKVGVDVGGSDLSACGIFKISDETLTITMICDAREQSAPHAICLAALKALEK